MSDQNTKTKSALETELEAVETKVLKALPGAAKIMVGGLVKDIFGFMRKVVIKQAELESRVNALTPPKQ